MKLHEFEARRIFKKEGIRIPKGFLARSTKDIKKNVKFLKFPVVLKAQVKVASRGKKGGIVFASDYEDVYSKAEDLFNSKIDGISVRSLLVVEAVKPIKEFYLGITIDRASKDIVLISSISGGEELEYITRQRPESIIRYNIDPLTGLRDYIIRKVASRLNLNFNKISTIIKALYRIFINYDCELAEINPLALTEDGLYALDTRMIIDDNALYRHKEFIEKEEKGAYEEIARKWGFSYVKLNGDVGIIGNGAGLTMATMDLVKECGGKPADFLDIGGGASANRVKEAMKILLKTSRIKVIFVNILGGITKCDEVAKGVVKALKEARERKKIVVRIKGTNEKEGKEILEKNGISFYEEMDVAARKVCEMIKNEHYS